MLDEDVYKKLLHLKAKFIQKNHRPTSISEVINQVLRDFLRN